jgi:hypothetical protein
MPSGSATSVGYPGSVEWIFREAELNSQHFREMEAKRLSADRGGIDLGDHEHPQSMTCAHHGWQMK